MSSSLAGDPIGAVLIPPCAVRFRTLAHLGDEPLEVNVTGWNKFAILAADRVFLFPRAVENVEWFERELAVCDVLASSVAVAPRVLARWHEEAVYPLPFAAVTRMPGTHPDDA